MITTQQMRELEDVALEQGISLAELMDQAGKAVYSAVRTHFHPENHHIIIFCGPGNNGGDGLAAARYFAQQYPVVVLFFGDKEKLFAEARDNYERIRKYIPIIIINTSEELARFQVQKNHPLVLIDALLGIGSKGTLRNPVSLAVDYFNSLSGIKVAVDVPTGVHADTGEILEKNCVVDLIVTFHDHKPGLEQFKEKTVVVDIGIPHK